MNPNPSVATRFKAGMPSSNPSGRPKNVFPSVAQILKGKNLEPIEELLKLLQSGDLKDRNKVEIWLQILPYVHSKAPAMNAGEEDELDKLSTAELVRLVKDQLPEVG